MIYRLLFIFVTIVILFSVIKFTYTSSPSFSVSVEISVTFNLMSWSASRNVTPQHFNFSNAGAEQSHSLCRLPSLAYTQCVLEYLSMRPMVLQSALTLCLMRSLMVVINLPLSLGLSCVVLLQFSLGIVVLIYPILSPLVGISPLENIPNGGFTCGKGDPDWVLVSIIVRLPVWR